jgi:sec-independent protein translocase protein TatB
MFDIGFSEIVVIGVVALLVFGPEELPRVARLAGHMLGKFRRYVDGVKSELSQEMEMAELKRLQEEVRDSARSIQNAVTDHLSTAENSMREVVAEVQQQGQTDPQALAERVPLAPAPAALVGGDEAGGFELTPPLGPEDEVLEAPPAPDEMQLDLFGVPVLKPVEHKIKADE